LFVLENKSLPNREAPVDDSAAGRLISVVWYEKVPDEESLATGDDVHVQPVGGRNGRLHILELTAAEISRAAGYYPVVTAEMTERDVELLHERDFVNRELTRHPSSRVTYAHGAGWGPDWTYIIHMAGSADVEDYCFEHRSINDLTKMALARLLQRRDGFSDERRGRLWGMLKHVLIAAVGEGIADADIDVYARARGRGRGAGRGPGPAPPSDDDDSDEDGDDAAGDAAGAGDGAVAPCAGVPAAGGAGGCGDGGGRRGGRGGKGKGAKGAKGAVCRGRGGPAVGGDGKAAGKRGGRGRRGGAGRHC
jgi:hypothetical protein